MGGSIADALQLGTAGRVEPRPGGGNAGGPGLPASTTGAAATPAGSPAYPYEHGFIGPDEQYARVIHLILKRQVQLTVYPRVVRTYYLQRAQVEQELYLQILAVAYARALCTLVGVAWVVYQRTAASLAVAAVLLSLAAGLGWRQRARWTAAVRSRLLRDQRFFERAYEDGMIALRRGHRACEYPRPWTAILGLGFEQSLPTPGRFPGRTGPGR